MKALENKVAIITGPGSGIGEATAKLFAEEKAKVVVSDIDEKNGKRVVSEIRENGGQAIFIKADASDPADNERLVNETLKEFGNLHISVNNAGIGGPLSLTADYPIDGGYLAQ